MPTLTTGQMKVEMLRIRRRMQLARAKLATQADREFARFLDGISAEIFRQWERAVRTFDPTPGPRLERSTRILQVRSAFLRQTVEILQAAERHVSTQQHPTWRTMLAAGESAISAVDRSVSLGGVPLDDPDAFSQIHLPVVRTGWDNVNTTMRGFNDNMLRQVRNQVTRGILLDDTSERLINRLAGLNKRSDRIRGLNRSDRYQRNRARQQVRGEMTRVYTQTVDRAAERAGFELFEHYGPIDARNVTAIGPANDPGNVTPRFSAKGSSDFIGDILSRSQWLQVTPTALTYGLHYGERGGFQPVADDWPGISETWAASAVKHGFETEPEAIESENANG